MNYLGGGFFYLLIAIGIVAVVIFIERFLELHRAQIDSSDFFKGVVNLIDAGSIDEALAICEETPAPVAAVAAVALHNRSAGERQLRDAVDAERRNALSRLERRISVLAIIADIAPLLGLLGTMIGFIRTLTAVYGIAAPVSRPELMTSAVGALVAGATGIAVSIPVLVMFSMLKIRLNRIASELEAATASMVGYFIGENAR